VTVVAGILLLVVQLAWWLLLALFVDAAMFADVLHAVHSLRATGARSALSVADERPRGADADAVKRAVPR
jgi:hypothetical protein